MGYEMSERLRSKIRANEQRITNRAIGIALLGLFTVALGDWVGPWWLAWPLHLLVGMLVGASALYAMHKGFELGMDTVLEGQDEAFVQEMNR